MDVELLDLESGHRNALAFNKWTSLTHEEIEASLDAAEKDARDGAVAIE